MKNLSNMRNELEPLRRASDNKKHSRKKLLLGILVISVLIGVVYATTYILYDWTISMTSATPTVRFIKWSDQTLYNTITLSYSIYASIWTYDDNATYGVRNTGASPVTVGIYINSISTSSYVTNTTVSVRDQATGNTVYATSTWQGGSLPTTKQTWSAAATTNYLIRVWVKGASSTGNVNIEMRLEV